VERCLACEAWRGAAFARRKSLQKDRSEKLETPFWQAAPGNDPRQDFNYRDASFRTSSVVDTSAVIPGSGLLSVLRPGRSPAAKFMAFETVRAKAACPTKPSGVQTRGRSLAPLQRLRKRGSAPIGSPSTFNGRCSRYSPCYGLKCQQTFLVERCAAAAVIRSLVFIETVTAGPARATQRSTRFVRR
jgi:hypothetical protein